MDMRDREVEEGDVVTYRLSSVSGGEKLVTHRVVRQETDGNYVTKGDANDVEDLTAVIVDQIVGTFWFSVPHAGYVLAKMNRKVAVVTAAWILLLNGASMALGMTVGDNKEKD